MKKFKFKLEPFLRYRQHLEKEAQMEVAKVIAQIDVCEKAIAAATAAHEETRAALAAEILEGIDSERYRRFNAYLAGMQNTIDTKRQQRHTLLNTLQKKQAVLARRSVEKKALENFKERRKSEYIHELATKEQEERDEMAVLRTQAVAPETGGQ